MTLAWVTTYPEALNGWTMTDAAIHNEAGAERHWRELAPLFADTLCSRRPLGDPDGDGWFAGQVTEEPSRAERAEVRGDFTYRSGEIAVELEYLAKGTGADLVIVGRFAHPHLHLGGVPLRLLAQSRHPVLVVP